MTRSISQADNVRPWRLSWWNSRKTSPTTFLKKHQLSTPVPQVDWSPDLLACEDGIGVYFNPEEGQEMMMSFDAVRRGFQKHGRDLREDESEMLRQFLYADAISPQFVRK